MADQVVTFRIDGDELARVDEQIKASEFFKGNRSAAIVYLLGAWADQRMRFQGDPRAPRAVRDAPAVLLAKSKRCALICPDPNCKPPRRNFGDPDWTCPEHGSAVVQPNHMTRADVEQALHDRG
jgi:hypothetical protein